MWNQYFHHPATTSAINSRVSFCAPLLIVESVNLECKHWRQPGPVRVSQMDSPNASIFSDASGWGGNSRNAPLCIRSFEFQQKRNSKCGEEGGFFFFFEFSTKLTLARAVSLFSTIVFFLSLAARPLPTSATPAIKCSYWKSKTLYHTEVLCPAAEHTFGLLELTHTRFNNPEESPVFTIKSTTYLYHFSHWQFKFKLIFASPVEKRK